MELNYAIAFLTSYNRWRRGDVSLNMPNPREIGIALDTVLAAVIEGGTGNSGVERPEPSPHFLQKGDSPETDALLRQQDRDCTPYDQASDQLVKLCRKLERERIEARQQEQIHHDNLDEAQAGYAKAERAEKMLRHAAAKADQWRECAEKLESFVYTPFAADEHAACAAALAEFKRLKEASK
jgi:hypothetical protein